MRPSARRRRLTVFLVALIVLGIGVAGVGMALERGEPSISVYLPDNEVQPGETETIELEIQNAGDVDVGTGGGETLIARGTTVEIDDEGPFEARTGETPIGPVADGESVPVAHRIDVPADIEPGEYEISVAVSYEYTSMVSERAGVVQRLSRTETHDVTLLVREGPRFTVSTIETDIEPGAGGDAVVEIENVGTTPAYDLRGTFNGTQSVLVGGGTAHESLGTLEPGEATAVTLDVAVDEGASAGAKPIEVLFEYDTAAGVPGEPRTVRTDLLPREPPSFTLDVSQNTLAVGTERNIVGTIENAGPHAIDDAVLVLETTSESVTIENDRYALPRLEPGETAEFRYPTTVTGDADAGPRQVRFTVEHSGASGDPLVSDAVTDRVEVDPAVAFSVESLADTLSVGYDGEIRGDVVNEGPRTVDDGVLVVEPMSDSLFVEDTRYALPELRPNESTEFRYPVDVSGQADPGPRQFRFTVEYSDGEGTPIESDSISRRVEIDPRQDEFSIDVVNATVAAGEIADLELEITNERPETLSEIDALLYTDSPLTSPGDSAYVPEIDPGESAIISFEIRADGDARATTHPVELDFEYRTERGETELSDTYRVGVDVTENPDAGSNGILSGYGWILVLAGIVAIAGAVYYRRRE